MKNLTFKEIPNTDEFGILFNLEKSSLAEWLTELSSIKPKMACLSILQTVQASNKKKINAKKRMARLNLVNKYLKHYIGQLKHSCWGASFPFSEDEKSYAEIIAWNYLALAEGYFLATEKSFLKELNPTSLSMAFDSIKQAQVHIAAVYCQPNKGFWALTYKIYALAEKGTSLDIELDNFKNLTLNDLFIQILTFHFCDTNQYSARDIRTIFNFLEQTCTKVDIHQNVENSENYLIFDLGTDNEPLNFKAFQNLITSSTRYFSPIIVSKNIDKFIHKETLWKNELKSINETLFYRVAKTLSLAETRHESRKKEENVRLGLIGFENILGFLYKATKDIDIHPEEKAAYKSSSEKRKGFNINSKKTAKNEIWNKLQNTHSLADKKVALKKIHLFDSSSSGYSLTWHEEGDSQVKVGDILGVLSKDKKRLEIAVIRRVTVTEDDKFRFGAEIIGLKSEIVYICPKNFNNKNTMWAILIPRLSEDKIDSLVYKTGYFAEGAHIYIQRNHQEISLATLKNELYSTADIVHSELTHL